VNSDPWRWRVSGRTLAVALPTPWQVLGWAPLGGGFTRADLIVNHQIVMGDLTATNAPHAHLLGVVRALRRDPTRAVGTKFSNGRDRSGVARVANGDTRPTSAVGMMTGADVTRAGHATVRREGLVAAAWCTAGCSNALRVGDRATAGIPRAADAQCSRSPTLKPGTINIIVAINQPLTRSAMAEALQLAVEARVAVLYDAGVMSVRSPAIATGTGTDCIVVAAPVAAPQDRANAIVYCGKHTLPGELIGQAVMRSCATALARSNPVTEIPAWSRARRDRG
jgi:adenosylcobinamide amidohydrolase